MYNVINRDVTDVLPTNYMPYTAYVITERALPSIDGFKPSQRRILYTMFLMKLLSGARKKSQGVVGQTMFLHPHGDASIYETLVRMARDSEALLVPFIDSKGNFGKQYSRDMQYASARYTECRLEPVSKELFKDINKNAVDMKDSYDGQMKEPTLLPVTFPTILTNPQIGTAVGMASSIASFNLKEVVDYTIAFMKDNSANVMDYIIAPDFPSGASIIDNKESLSKVMNTGSGSINMRAKYKIKDKSIVFYEIPYSTTYEAIMDKISELVKNGNLKDIVDIHDITGINEVGIEVEVKNNTDKEMLVEKLFKMTPLQSPFKCNFNMIIDGKPKVLGVKGIIEEWVKFRKETVKRVMQFDMNKKENRMNMLLAFNKIVLDIDRAIEIIRNTKKNSEIVLRLQNEFGITEEQAEFIAEIKLRNLNEEYITERINEIKTLKDDIKELSKKISSDNIITDLIIQELEQIKQTYGVERKTDVIEVKELPKGKVESISVENYNVRVFITKEGYIKKIPLTSLRGNYTINVKDGDSIISEVETENVAELLVFTDKRNVYKRKLYDIVDSKPSLLGEYMPNLLELKDEAILYATVTNDFTGDLLIGYDDGKVAKIALKAYETKQNRSMLKNAYADKKAIYFNHIYEDIDLIAESSIDKVVLFNTSMINSKTSKTTIGVQVQKQKDGSTTNVYITVDQFESDVDIEYYRVKSAGVGKYKK